MKTILKTIFVSSIIFLSCTTPKTEKHESLPEVQFAIKEIEKAKISQQNSENFPAIEFLLDTISLKTEAYRVQTSKNKIVIFGGDNKGMMYGGLEVAEQIKLNNLIKDTKGEPFIKKRAIKFNIPLDARTPSYDDSGDAAQKNILNMWDWNFWTTFFDEMAIHRYNAITFWNPHPFPSMIKLEEYPDIALEDVCTTTLTPVGKENEWGDPQLVTSNVMNNLKVVKKITIDEKIIFWQKLMRYAKERGIDTYFITWNICPNSVATPMEPYYKTFGINIKNEKPGKYGITHQMDNPKTIAYHREAVKQFLVTYPDLKGIGVTAGEHMPKKWEGEYNREQWLWESFGLGILDAKKEQPDRKIDFIHRVWHSDMEQIMKYWGEYPDSFEVSFKYAKARLYSSPTPNFADEHIKTMKTYDLDSWWNLRNDDIFVYRWGDPDYVRTFLNNFPKERTAAYQLGSDGYVWGKEFISKHQELSGQLEIKKHWYNFMLWGRLGYNNQLDQTFFIKKLSSKFPGIDSKLLYKTWQEASKIVPQVNTFHWRNWDHMWSVEACIARPALGGFREVTDFIDNPIMSGSNIINPSSFAKASIVNEKINKITPLQIVNRLNTHAISSRNGIKKLQEQSIDNQELSVLLDDILAMGYLGQYYAKKIEAAVALAFYTETKQISYKNNAITYLEEALEHWKAYTHISEKNYSPQMLARTNKLDWSQLIQHVKQDITIARNF
ncbi:hypothetical protein AWE51_10380 [Aquimarina aggregata]|uniref:Carbohydrate-binding family 6 protein n=1 Tax=Aquimarina aggregata TaxID=1642818 RepID=A0A162ZU62_9FLAO|nr:hypothetical protein [Aquimarina aggregata]KZS40037.1 hypothetical protein AWE51_10380 [Aquimarina aggregata]